MTLNLQDMNVIKQLLQDMDLDLEELTQLMEEILTISRLSLTSEENPTAEIPINSCIDKKRKQSRIDYR